MSKYVLLTFILLLISNLMFAQVDSTRTLDYYFNEVDSLEYSAMKKAGLITEENSLAEEYLDKETQRINEKGFLKYLEIKGDIYVKYFRDYHFLQSVYFKDNVYVLYFSIAGTDDIEFQIVGWKQKDWMKSEKLSKEIIDAPYQKFQKIAFNYDEGPKNLENVRIFLKNDYLIMERSGLYHSLYDLRTEELLINEVCPYFLANTNDLTQMNIWIKDNIHSKIENIINISR